MQVGRVETANRAVSYRLEDTGSRGRAIKGIKTMKRLSAIAASTLCAAFFTLSSAAFAQKAPAGAPKPAATGGHPITPAQRATSNRFMTTGLTQLQAASVAMKSNKKT